MCDAETKGTTVGINSETRVELGGLLDYYERTAELQSDLGQVWMPSAGTAATAYVGASGVTEALRFGQKYAGVIEALNKFVSDSGLGLHYLADGALSIADNYLAGDVGMAAEMTSVADAFAPTAQRSDVTDAANAQLASQREAYFHPDTAPAKEQLPRAKFPVCQADTDDLTPDEDANNHSKKYEGLETWHPNEPEPQTDFGPHVSVI